VVNMHCTADELVRRGEPSMGSSPGKVTSQIKRDSGDAIAYPSKWERTSQQRFTGTLVGDKYDKAEFIARIS
jgi:hypothetical protein